MYRESQVFEQPFIYEMRKKDIFDYLSKEVVSFRQFFGVYRSPNQAIFDQGHIYFKKEKIAILYNVKHSHLIRNRLPKSHFTYM